MARQRAAAVAAPFLTVFTCLGLLVSAQAPRQPQDPPGQGRAPVVPSGLAERAAREGRVRVLVELQLPGGAPVAEAVLPNPAAVLAQRQAIAGARGRVISRILAGNGRVVRQYDTVPYVALELGPAALVLLEQAAADIVRVREDAILRTSLASSVPFIEGDQAWASGYDGAGTVVAIVDSGVDATHPFLSGKVVAEACFSSTVPGTSLTLCPNGLEEQIGPGSAAPCPRSECIHGTHVAGIAAGNGDNAGQSFSGVARAANIMAVQVFSDVIDPNACGGVAPCMGAFESDVVAGLEHVYTLALGGQLNLVAANMSLGGGSFAGTCDAEPYKPSIDNLRAINIASVVASGNAFDPFNMASPACVSSAVSVGSSSAADAVSWFSNVSPVLQLLAPGENIVSSTPVGTYQPQSGTSMAAPHVTGAWAIVRQGAPAATVGAVLNAFRTTGVPITDTRFWGPGTTTVPRVRVLQALSTLAPVTSPVPSISGVSPDRVRAGAAVTLTVTGSGFNALSVVRWNGMPSTTTIVSATQLRATIPAGHLTVGTSTVSVFNPAPGGGTSAELPVVVDPPAILSVDATTVGPGSAVTVTLENGYGGGQDWIALAATGASDTSYLQWTYVGAGVTSRTWTATLPSTAGTYEFRLFLNNGYGRVATSPSVTVDPSYNPVPVALSLSPSTATAGGPGFTLTVNGSGFVAASTVSWNGTARPTTYVSATQVRAAIAAADIAAVGVAQVRVVNPAPGGGTTAPLAFTVKSPPTLTVDATTVTAGQTVTVTLTGGLGGGTDWLAFASVSAPATSYLHWVYVGSGVTTRTWTVTAPSTTGPYEFRLFLNNGYTRLATSPTVTVEPPPPQVPVLSSLSPGSAAAGGTGFTLTAWGSNFTAASVVRWNGADRPTTFVSASQLQATISAADIAVAGVAQVTVSTPPPGGGTSAALPFAINAPPSLSVSATSVAGGAAVTVTLSNGAGGSLDWLALASTTAPNSSYLQWVYVGAGVTSRTWTVAMPSVAGTYEFRLFVNNGFTRAATSAAVTVTPPPPAALSVSATAVAPGTPVTVTLTNGKGGSQDWLALAASSAPNTSYLQWVYVGAGVTSRTWTVTMPSTPGTYEFRLFINNGYTRIATSPPVVVGQ